MSMKETNKESALTWSEQPGPERADLYKMFRCYRNETDMSKSSSLNWYMLTPVFARPCLIFWCSYCWSVSEVERWRLSISNRFYGEADTQSVAETTLYSGQQCRPRLKLSPHIEWRRRWNIVSMLKTKVATLPQTKRNYEFGRTPLLYELPGRVKPALPQTKEHAAEIGHNMAMPP